MAGSCGHGSHFLSPGPPRYTRPRLQDTLRPCLHKAFHCSGPRSPSRGPPGPRARVWRAAVGGRSPVGAAGSVPVAGSEEGLVYTLHKGLGHGALGSPDDTHPASVGAGGRDGARTSAGGSQGWDPPTPEARGARHLGRGFPDDTLSRDCRETPAPWTLGAAPREG